MNRSHAITWAHTAATTRSSVSRAFTPGRSGLSISRAKSPKAGAIAIAHTTSVGRMISGEETIRRDQRQVGARIMRAQNGTVAKNASWNSVSDIRTHL